MPEQSFMFHQNGQQAPVSAAHGISSVDIVAISNEAKDLGRRLRTLEERYTNLQTKTQITEQNMLSRNKRVDVELKTISMEMNELKKEISEIKDKIFLLIKEIQMCAKKEEMQVLQKYINMWEPVNFVTRNEVNDIIIEILRKNNIKIEQP